MTPQEIFDQVWDWFVVKGNKPSSDDRGKCLYRGPDNTKCAFGVVLPDHLYKGEMENAIGSAVFRGHKEVCEYFGVPQNPYSLCPVDVYHPVVYLLTRLQWAHDDATAFYNTDKKVDGETSALLRFRDKIEQNLTEVAANRNLVVPEKQNG